MLKLWGFFYYGCHLCHFLVLYGLKGIKIFYIPSELSTCFLPQYNSTWRIPWWWVFGSIVFYLMCWYLWQNWEINVQGIQTPSLHPDTHFIPKEKWCSCSCYFSEDLKRETLCKKFPYSFEFGGQNRRAFIWIMNSHE